MGKKETLVQVNHVFKYFYVGDQKIPVLKDVSTSIERGDFSIVFGPSGCGKSTMLHTVLGLEPPTNGSVLIKQTNLYSKSEDEIAEIRKHSFGTIYQQSNWVGALSVLENVAFPLVLRGEEKHVALTKGMTFLKSVEMDRWANHRPTELSAGQQQKVSLARCLVTDPDLIIADEPTGNLDHKSGQSLMDLFKRLNNEGITIVMVTHDLAYLTYAKKIIQMFDGEVINHVDTTGLSNEELQKILIPEEGSLQQKLKHTNIKIEEFDAQKEIKRKPSIFSHIPSAVKGLLRNLFEIIATVYLLFLYSLNGIISNTTSFLFKFLGPVNHLGTKFIIIPWQQVYRTITRHRSSDKSRSSITRIDLVDLSILQLNAKRSRSVITIGGIGLGIGFILFLLSVGYGLENLVIGRVASLKERRQIQVIPSISANLIISDETVEQFQDFDGAKSVFPTISAAAKLNYGNSNLDVVSYAVSADYVDNLDARIEAGSNFPSSIVYNGFVEPYPQNDDDTSTDENSLLDDVLSPEEEESDLLMDYSSQTQGTSDSLLTLPDTRRVALVNTVLADILDLDPEDIIDKQIKLQFILNGNQVDKDRNVASELIEYTIVGVLADETSPVVFVPISDLQQLGVTNYSQTTILASDESVINSLRRHVQSLGFTTLSISDTVKEIEEIFRLFKIVLAGIGLIGLSIATLGMINTLTVSLLERTREIGFMKAIGMKSSEIFDLMITEATAMGAIGGLAGLVLGFLAGKILSLIISTLSVSQGGNLIDIAQIPAALTFITFFSSAAIGTLTGLYPARRSAKISALNALRYE